MRIRPYLFLIADVKSPLLGARFSVQYGNQRLGISPPKPAEVGMGSRLFLEISSDTFQELGQYFFRTEFEGFKRR